MRGHFVKIPCTEIRQNNRSHLSFPHLDKLLSLPALFLSDCSAAPPPDNLLPPRRPTRMQQGGESRGKGSLFLQNTRFDARRPSSGYSRLEQAARRPSLQHGFSPLAAATSSAPADSGSLSWREEREGEVLFEKGVEPRMWRVLGAGAGGVPAAVRAGCGILAASSSQLQNCSRWEEMEPASFGSAFGLMTHQGCYTL